MTTSNLITTDQFDDVLFVPLEAVHQDSVAFVFLEEGGKPVRQEVITGLANESEIIIAFGVEAGERIYLSIPENSKSIPIRFIDPIKKGEIAALQMQEKEARDQKKRELGKQVKDDYIQTESATSSSFIIFN